MTKERFVEIMRERNYVDWFIERTWSHRPSESPSEEGFLFAIQALEQVAPEACAILKKPS